jgi:hypothetical protein
MNPENARALVGEATRNLAPYLDLPVMRRPDATGEIPAQREPRPVHLAAHARPGRHRPPAVRRSRWGWVVAAEVAVVIALALLVARLVVTR